MFVKRLSLLLYIFCWKGINSFPIPRQITENPNGALHFEDMILLPHSEDEIGPRTFLTSEGKWPTTIDNGTLFVYIPYRMVDFDPELEELLRKFLDEFTENSCVRFVPQTREEHYLTFTSVPGVGEPSHVCFANIGMSNDNEYQRVILYPQYTQNNEVICFSCIGGDSRFLLFNFPHEMMHALGFIHEHQRLDRDCYITIEGQYLEDEISYGLYRYLPTDDTFPYDPNSVMHYPSGRGEFTSKFGDYLGPKGNTLSEMDWMKLNYMYCDGPHICETDPEQCEKHKNIQNECGYSNNNKD